MWVCPKCKRENQGTFCYVCGTEMPKVNDIEEQYQNQQIPYDSEFQYDEEMPNDTQYCQNANNQIPDNKKVSKGLVIFLCASLIMLTGAVASFATVMVMRNNDSNSGNKTEITETETTAPIANQAVQSTKEPVSNPVNELSDEVETPEVTVSEVVTYGTYNNNSYRFYCAYPLNFTETTPSGANVLKQYISLDGSAVMKIRASRNASNITIEQALQDLYNTYDGEVTYKASKSTWYAISLIKNDGRIFYRKLLMKNNNIYSMDFEIDPQDLDKYSPYIEYIEDNFKAY